MRRKPSRLARWRLVSQRLTKGRLVPSLGSRVSKRKLEKKKLDCGQRFDARVLASSRKLRRAAQQLIDGSEKRICRLIFEF